MADRYLGPEVVAGHLSNVQGGPSSATDTEIEAPRNSPQLHQPATHAPTDFTMEELDYVITSLKKNKAPGPDEVRAEVILVLNYWGQQELLKIINQCFRERKVLQSWKEALIVSIFKGKGSDYPANYRLISLLNTFYEMYASLLQIRLAAEHMTITYGIRNMDSERLDQHRTLFSYSDVLRISL